VSPDAQNRRGKPGHGGSVHGDPGHGDPSHGDPGHGDPSRGDPGRGDRPGSPGSDDLGALPLWAPAPAKINLGLFLGPVRADGRHELVSVMQSISLADELTLEWAPAGASGDQLHCPGVGGPPEQNLAARALADFRCATGWAAPPLRLSVSKRIPLAAGLGGGSADAAATLRLVALAAGIADEALLRALADGLGADVAAQVTPGRWLASGSGERLHALPDPDPPLGVLVMPGPHGLSTAKVYAKADALALARDERELVRRADALLAALAEGAPLPGEGDLLHNDLQAAAIALCPAIERRLAHAREQGANATIVSGSGSASVGLFGPPDGPARASAAAAAIATALPGVSSAFAVGAAFARARAPATRAQAPATRPPATSQ
jgi:4-diphosphocytidyl-2-C-methyl-D-erythritol kinase